MNKKERKQWLEAIKKMRKYYEEKSDSSRDDCPLCEAAGDSCENCLWLKFEKKDCCIYAISEFGRTVRQLKNSRDPAWVKDSLERLSRWEERLRKEK